MGDYTSEFYKSIARNELNEMDDWLVSYYIGGIHT